jgi:hypothetical protein
LFVPQLCLKTLFLQKRQLSLTALNHDAPFDFPMTKAFKKLVGGNYYPILLVDQIYQSYNPLLRILTKSQNERVVYLCTESVPKIEWPDIELIDMVGEPFDQIYKKTLELITQQCFLIIQNLSMYENYVNSRAFLNLIHEIKTSKAKVVVSFHLDTIENEMTFSLLKTQFDTICRVLHLQRYIDSLVSFKFLEYQTKTKHSVDTLECGDNAPTYLCEFTLKRLDSKYSHELIVVADDTLTDFNDYLKAAPKKSQIHEVSFNVGITDKQEKDRKNVALPYLRAQNENVSVINYVPEFDDDFDDEDPDADLEI